MEKFDSIYARAAERKGGELGLESIVSRHLLAMKLPLFPKTVGCRRFL